jgi:formylglycine-generating enzyme required for sulfatase activity
MSKAPNVALPFTLRSLLWPALFCLGLALGIGVAVAVVFLQGPSTAGMVWVPGGWFDMGSEEFADAEPVHRVWVDGFWMDETEVTNAQFRAFVEATGYTTVAERVPTAEQFPNVPPEDLRPFSLVFSPPKDCPLDARDCDECKQWKLVYGANWKHPRGPDDSIEGKDNYPAVHICHEDALAYCKWAGKRLPTEAEWEFAARGGLKKKKYYWGDERNPDGKWMANTFQGKFPSEDTGEDGFAGLAPVKSFPPNGYGLYDMAGNAWEWCSDYYQPRFRDLGPDGTRRNPTGPKFSIDTHWREEVKYVLRGGSFLCADGYCKRYMAGGRQQGEPSTGQNHTGFRCALSPWGRR